MVKYSCEKCGKEFTQKGHYIKHSTKKNPCVVESKMKEIIEKVVAEKLKELKENEIIPQVKADALAEADAKIKFIDLFCGIGSFHYSFKKLGWECVMACDIDKAAKETYKTNYGTMPLGDITEIDPKSIPAYDILCAGFPCFVSGTQTLTNNGYKKIEDVGITDKLLTHTGQFQNILNLQRKIYNGYLFEIKIKYHPELIIATEEHPFYIREKKGQNVFGNPVWKKAMELTMNDYFGMIINNNTIIPEFTFEKNINQHKTEQIHIKLDRLDYWFVMGYFVGDGWIEETTKKDGRCMHKIRFAINSQDEDEVFEKINKVIPNIDKRCNTGKCKKFGCSNFIWYNIFKQFGKYAHNKLIPEWVQDAPKEFIQEFINGYMKADGCCINNKILQITTVSLNLAYGLQRLYLKLGHIFSINKCVRPKTFIIEGRTVNQRDTYCIRGILHKERKISSFIEDNYIWFAPFKITKRDTTNMPVYNFEVENDNSYVVENTIVHNCQPFSNCGQHKGFDDKRGTLFFNIMKFVDHHKPNIIALENVQGLLNHDGGKTFERIKSDIQTAGYTITYKVIKCSDYGLPQMRKRLIIIGVRTDTALVKHIDQLLNFDGYKRETTLTELLGKNFEKKIAYTIRCGGKNSPIDDKHNWDGYRVDGEEYRLTKEDCLKIQGFNADFKLCGTNKDQWKQLGNTIPTIFTEIIGKQIANYYKRT
jgi:site-specific DNA-cytosine methylase/intein/homing endonuclease